MSLPLTLVSPRGVPIIAGTVKETVTEGVEAKKTIDVIEVYRRDMAVQFRLGKREIANLFRCWKRMKCHIRGKEVCAIRASCGVKPCAGKRVKRKRKPRALPHSSTWRNTVWCGECKMRYS